MRIMPHIYLVASGRLGCMLTDAWDCNVYLVDCGGEYALIDSGSGRDVEALIQVVREDGLDPRNIRHVLLTHAHADHAGGCAMLRERLKVNIWGSQATAQWVSAGDEAAISLDRARAAGIYPADYQFQACPITHVVEHSMAFTIGTTTFTPIATPGHADGHLSYLVELDGRSCLFVGDLLMCGGRVLLQYAYDCSIPRLGQSLQRLVTLHVDALLPGHLHFCLREGQAHITAAIAYLDRLLVPPSLA